MSKLIITSTENGKIRYIEGEEIEVSVSDLEKKVAELQEKVSKSSVAPETEFASINRNLEAKKANRLAKRDAEIKAVEARYQADIQAYEKEAQGQREQKTREFASRVRPADIQEAEKQITKLKAVLQNVKPSSQPTATATPVAQNASRVRPQVVQQSVKPAQVATTQQRVVVKPEPANRTVAKANTPTTNTSRRIVF